GRRVRGRQFSSPHPRQWSSEGEWQPQNGWFPSRGTVFSGISRPSRSKSVTVRHKKLYRGAAEVCLNHSAHSPKLAGGGNSRKSEPSGNPHRRPHPQIITHSVSLPCIGSLLHAACLFLTQFAMIARSIWKIHASSRSVPGKA